MAYLFRKFVRNARLKNTPSHFGTTHLAQAETILYLSCQLPNQKLRHHGRLGGAMVSTASRLLPLVELLDSLQPYVVNESVFRIRRRKITA